MLYIVTAVHDRYKITQKFIGNLKKQTYQNYRLILVDDGSSDGTAEMVKKELSNSIVLTGDGNLWWGGALHLAYQHLVSDNYPDCEAVMFANDDINMPVDFLETGMKYLKQNEKTLITGCGYSVNNGELLDGSVIYNCKTGECSDPTAGEDGNCASTRALFVKYEDFVKIGGFHPVLLPHYSSDYEYTIRACRKGLTVKSFKDLKYTFDEGTTGFNTLKRLNIKQLFSKRSRFNPIYRIIFMFMVTPIYYIPNNIIRGLERAKAEKNK